MKKVLLATGIFLSIGFIATAQEKKAATATTGTPATAIAKQRNNQKALLPQGKMQMSAEQKNQMLKDRENGTKGTTKSVARKSSKRTVTRTKTTVQPAN